ncbi:MAG: M20/M25/M40 family metallo-hydrolase [Sphingobacteriaceae bacterium]
MKKLALSLLFIGTSLSIFGQSVEKIKERNVSRIIKTLTADDMEGRATFSAGIDRAANFIESEFKKIGLQPLAGESTFRQSFSMNRIKPLSSTVSVNGKALLAEQVLISSDQTNLSWTEASGIENIQLAAGATFVNRYREILRANKSAIVWVDPQYTDAFKRLRDASLRTRMAEKPRATSVVFILSDQVATSYSITASNSIDQAPLCNVAGMIPGKSKAKEYVVFSGHYDHLGIVKAVEGDSIANGADDDASGTTAVIALAKYYKKLNNNERTLIFVAFTAEEVGGFGSRYFSSKLNPDEVVAMFNIEMIGKESKFGKNNAFITGYERSDFGEILQRNLVGTDFKFYPDPYPSQNLFYRSDNATLAALGVPAHTISTDQIDIDKFYHTVNDEVETLDVSNITATIKAIALSSRSIVSGKDTPKRIPKL